MTVLATMAFSAGAQELLVSDVFNRTSGLGSKWQVSYGTFTTDGTYAITGTPPSNGGWARIVTPLGTNDYSVSSDITVPAGSTYSGIVARSSNSAFDRDLYAAQISTAGSVSLYRRNTWTWTLLSSTPASITAGASYNLKLVAVGTSPVQLQVWLNGVKAISFSDSSNGRIQAGVAGIQAYNAGVKYANVRVATAIPDLFADAFDRTTGLGANWQAVYGTYTTNGTYAISGAPPINGNWARVIPALGTNDYSISADIVVPSGSHLSGLVARSSAIDAFDRDLYAAQLDTAGAVRLYRRNAWTWTSLASTSTTIIAGVSYNLKLLVSGVSPVRLAVWLNGTEVLAFDDGSASRLAEGAAGIESYNSGVQYANFKVDALKTVTVPFVGSGTGTVAGRGMSCSGTCDLKVPQGTVLSLTGAPASSASRFDGFVGNCLGTGNCTVVASQDTSVTATMNVATATVFAIFDGDNGGIVTSNPPNDDSLIPPPEYGVTWEDYIGVTTPVGGPVTFTFHPYAGFAFTDWTGPCAGQGNPCTLTPTSNAFTVPRFTYAPPPTVTVRVKIDSAYPGSVTGPNGFACNGGSCTLNVGYGSTLVLSAAPATGFRFLGWLGDVPSWPSNSPSVTINTRKLESSVVAYFAPAEVAYPCGSQPCARGQFPPATWRPYDRTSAFNRTVPANPPLLPGSTQMVSRMLGDMALNKQPANLWLPADGLSGWPTYYGRSTDPTYVVTCASPWGTTCAVASMPGKAPAGAQIQGNNGTADADRHLTFIDQVSMLEYDLWGVATNPLPAGGGTIETIWSGYTTAAAGDGRTIEPGEGTAAGVGNLAGRVRIEELKDAIANDASDGYINHALSITVSCTNGQYVYPSNSDSNGTCPSPADTPPMGARVWLDMSFAQIDALPIPAWKKVFLRTLSKYGAIIMDHGSVFYFTIQTESGNQYTSMGVPDAWLALASNMVSQHVPNWNRDAAGNYTGTWHNTDNGVNWTTQVWNNLRVLSPCVSDGSCNP